MHVMHVPPNVKKVQITFYFVFGPFEDERIFPDIVDDQIKDSAIQMIDQFIKWIRNSW